MSLHPDLTRATLDLSPLEAPVGPAVPTPEGIDIAAKRAADIPGKPAARDVRHARDRLLAAERVDEPDDRLRVDARRLEQDIDQPLAAEFGVSLRIRELRVLHDAADERVAVRVDAARGQRDHEVAHLRLWLLLEARVLDDADAESRDIEVAGRVDVGHLGAFAADERAACDLAALRDARDHRGRVRGVELREPEIVEEEQRLGALDDEVVDVHRHTVDADRVVDLELDRELHLRADAVGAADEDGILVLLAGAVQLEHPRERAMQSEDARRIGAPHDRLDAVDDLVARVDVDARGGVGEGLLLRRTLLRCGGGGHKAGECNGGGAARWRAARFAKSCGGCHVLSTTTAAR